MFGQFLCLCGALHKRKNWMLIGSEASGPKVAAIMSIIETCRRLNIRHVVIDPAKLILKPIMKGEWPE